MDAAADKHVPKAQDYRLRARPASSSASGLRDFEEEPLGPELLPLSARQLHVGLGLPAPDRLPDSREAIAHAFRASTALRRAVRDHCARLYGFG